MAVIEEMLGHDINAVPGIDEFHECFPVLERCFAVGLEAADGPECLRPVDRAGVTVDVAQAAEDVRPAGGPAGIAEPPGREVLIALEGEEVTGQRRHIRPPLDGGYEAS